MIRIMAFTAAPRGFGAVDFQHDRRRMEGPREEQVLGKNKTAKKAATLSIWLASLAPNVPELPVRLESESAWGPIIGHQAERFALAVRDYDVS